MKWFKKETPKQWLRRIAGEVVGTIKKTVRKGITVSLDGITKIGKSKVTKRVINFMCGVFVVSYLLRSPKILLLLIGTIFGCTAVVAVASAMTVCCIERALAKVSRA